MDSTSPGDDGMQLSASTIGTILRNPLIQVIVIALAGVSAYSNTFGVPFVLDDFHVIVENARLNGLGTMLRSGLFSDSRWFALATLAINKSVGGLDVTGFHAVNLAIHLAVAVIIYLLTKATISTFTDEALQHYHFAPLIASLGFVLHPIHTEAVTYIVQRMTSLATLLYLGSLLLHAQAYGGKREERGGGFVRQRLLSGAALACCLLAISSKEISYTLPVVLTLYDSCFLKGTVRERALRLAPYFICTVMVFFWLIGVDKMTDVFAHGGGDTSGRSLPYATYLLTELCVLATYLRLLVLPVGQNLDYDYPPVATLFAPQPMAALLLVLVLCSGGIFWLTRSFRPPGENHVVLRIAGFALIWFFVTISIEGGIVPLIDTIFEHRVYLPSVWFFIFIGIAVCEVCRRVPASSAVTAICTIVLMAGYGHAAFQRNSIWGDASTLWSDVTKKSPGKARGWTSLGISYLNKSDPERAIPLLERAVRLNPEYYLAHVWLGQALILTGDSDRALEHLRITTRLAPGLSQGWEMAGRLLFEKKQMNEAALFLGRAREINPGGFSSQDELQRSLDPAYRPVGE